LGPSTAEYKLFIPCSAIGVTLDDEGGVARITNERSHRGIEPAATLIRQALPPFGPGLEQNVRADPDPQRTPVAAIHPVVRVHPETGRKSLFVNEHFTRRIVELSHQESDALLAFLTSWATRPQFTVRYHWTAGTIAMWDNRCTQHCVLNDFEGDRVIQRVTVMGDKPTAAAPARWQPYIGPVSAASRHDWQLQNHLRAKQ
jgi:hypothetical protein